jgi:hypothetical protein
LNELEIKIDAGLRSLNDRKDTIKSPLRDERNSDTIQQVDELMAGIKKLQNKVRSA